MRAPRPYRLIFSGGGTAGHIFPAIAIAQCFRARYPDVQILFVGARDRIEMVKVPQAGFEIVGLWISGFQRKKIIANLLLPIKIIVSIGHCVRILSRFKPNAVISTGGYAGASIGIAAGWAGIPLLVQEQNSYAGVANRLISRYASRICVAYPRMERYFPKDKIVFTGNPTTNQPIVPDAQKRREALTHFSLEDDRPILLITGGTLGAKTINESILAGLDKIVADRVQVIWQMGQTDYQQMQQYVTERNYAGVRCHAFIQRMDLAYQVANLVVSRAGALTLSELSLMGKAAILVPSPNVAEDHQTKNARVFEEQQAAVLISDGDAKQKLVFEALSLLKDNDRQARLAERISSMATPHAAQDIVAQIESVIRCD